MGYDGGNAGNGKQFCCREEMPVAVVITRTRLKPIRIVQSVDRDRNNRSRH